VRLRGGVAAAARPRSRRTGPARARPARDPAARQPARGARRARAARAGERVVVPPVRRPGLDPGGVRLPDLRGVHAAARAVRPAPRHDELGPRRGREAGGMSLRASLRSLVRSPGGWIALGTLLRLVHILSLGNRYYFGDTLEYESAA